MFVCLLRCMCILIEIFHFFLLIRCLLCDGLMLSELCGTRKDAYFLYFMIGKMEIKNYNNITAQNYRINLQHFFVLWPTIGNSFYYVRIVCVNMWFLFCSQSVNNTLLCSVSPFSYACALFIRIHNLSLCFFLFFFVLREILPVTFILNLLLAEPQKNPVYSWKEYM